jgi:hypothetical protein
MKMLKAVGLAAGHDDVDRLSSKTGIDSSGPAAQ